MTDKNKQALDALKDYRIALAKSWIEQTKNSPIKAVPDVYETLENALQPKSNIKHKDIVEIARNFLERWDGGLAIGSATEEMQKVIQDLQPKPSVDVEGLKQDTIAKYTKGHSQGVKQLVYSLLNEVFDYLHSQGHLNQGWQPIETAPKEGTTILLMDDEDYSGICVVSDWWHEYSNGDGHWENAECMHDFTPKYWMTLPQPSSEDE
jgi:hypothetical protein